jgi:hypothetical protein
LILHSRAFSNGSRGISEGLVLKRSSRRFWLGVRRRCTPPNRSRSRKLPSGRDDADSHRALVFGNIDLGLVGIGHKPTPIPTGVYVHLSLKPCGYEFQSLAHSCGMRYIARRITVKRVACLGRFRQRVVDSQTLPVFQGFSCHDFRARSINATAMISVRDQGPSRLFDRFQCGLQTLYRSLMDGNGAIRNFVRGRARSLACLRWEQPWLDAGQEWFRFARFSERPS